MQAKILPIEEILENLQYCENSPSGLIWKTNYSLRSKKGQTAGTRQRKGYWVVRLSGKLYYNHRIVWYLNKLEIDNLKDIDHVDGNKSNNLIDNLRNVSRSKNLLNKKSKSKSTNYKYIRYREDRNSFVVRISHNGLKLNKSFSNKNNEGLSLALAFRDNLLRQGLIPFFKDWHDHQPCNNTENML